MNASLQSLGDLDRVLHEPSRMMITAILYSADEADFLYLLNATSLTRGNLSTHLARLEEAGYVEIEKTYRGKVPRTICRLTAAGRTAFDEYRRQLREIVDTLESRDEKGGNERLLARDARLKNQGSEA